MSNVTSRLDATIKAVCPIHGASVRFFTNSGPVVRIDFRPEATDEQRTAAQAVVDSFDWSGSAQTAWEATRNIPAAGALLQSADPVPQAVRVLFRATVDELNNRLRGAGIEPVLEAQIFARVAQYLGEGLSLPG